MLSHLSLLKQAANRTANKSNLPDSSLVVEALLKTEKEAKKGKNTHSLDELIGCWDLCFITGTKKTRKKVGIVLGAGKYISKLIGIEIAYDREPQQNSDTGRVKNSVKLAFFTLSLTGPVKFVESKSILAFDFTKIAIAILGIKLYEGYIRGGKAKETEFYNLKISQQAFFSYFLIEPEIIAARGKGGGLALWSRSPLSLS